MKGIIEQEIENYADKYEKYPESVEVSETEWNKLQKELKRELLELGLPVPKDITEFRGCKLVINKTLSEFRVTGKDGRN